MQLEPCVLTTGPLVKVKNCHSDFLMVIVGEHEPAPWALHHAMQPGLESKSFGRRTVTKSEELLFPVPDIQGFNPDASAHTYNAGAPCNLVSMPVMLQST
jgi:hypothetical protein